MSAPVGEICISDGLNDLLCWPDDDLKDELKNDEKIGIEETAEMILSGQRLYYFTAIAGSNAIQIVGEIDQALNVTIVADEDLRS